MKGLNVAVWGELTKAANGSAIWRSACVHLITEQNLDGISVVLAISITAVCLGQEHCGQ